MISTPFSYWETKTFSFKEPWTRKFTISSLLFLLKKCKDNNICHGDLSFSNIGLYQSKLILIDTSTTVDRQCDQGAKIPDTLNVAQSICCMFMRDEVYQKMGNNDYLKQVLMNWTPKFKINLDSDLSSDKLLACLLLFLKEIDTSFINGKKKDWEILKTYFDLLLAGKVDECIAFHEMV